MRPAAWLLAILLPFALQAEPGKRVLGTPGALLEGLQQNGVRADTICPFVCPDGDEIDALVEDFHFQEGQLSMSGRILGSDDSLFILKGDKLSLYGWTLQKDKNLAYEYTTNDQGQVVVEKVPVEQVYSIDDFELPPNFQWSKERIPEFDRPSGGAFPAHIGKYNGANLNKLQSLPGAKKVIFLDISRMMKGDTPKSQSKEDVWWTWQCVATGYSCYQANVTTDPAVYKAAGVSNSCILRFLDTEGRSSSPVNVFGTSQFATVYRLRGEGHPPGGYSTGRTAWHEAGHIMGVMDYGGQPGGTYFQGFPQYKWVPIMGNFWYADPWKDDAAQQWSKGEYDTATTKSDVIKVTNRNLPYREDCVTKTAPIKFNGGGKVTPEDNFGQICPHKASDTYTFAITGDKGHAKLKIYRIEYASMLDVDATILDEAGKSVAHSNPEAKRHAEFDLDLKAGKYKLVVKGGAEGTPQKGFSTYGSIGFYGIEGEITGAGLSN